MEVLKDLSTEPVEVDYYRLTSILKELLIGRTISVNYNPTNKEVEPDIRFKVVRVRFTHGRSILIMGEEPNEYISLESRLKVYLPSDNAIEFVKTECRWNADLKKTEQVDFISLRIRILD